MPYGSEKCLLLDECWRVAEHLLSHRLPCREGMILPLSLGAERLLRASSFQLFKQQFIPQEQGRSGHHLPVIPFELLNINNLATHL